jgi:hypothetical protein
MSVFVGLCALIVIASLSFFEGLIHFLAWPI